MCCFDLADDTMTDTFDHEASTTQQKYLYVAVPQDNVSLLHVSLRSHIGDQSLFVVYGSASDVFS